MPHGQDQLADYDCDSGIHLDGQYYHACGSQHNPQGKSNSTGSDIEDLKAMAQVSIDKDVKVLKAHMSCINSESVFLFEEDK